MAAADSGFRAATLAPGRFKHHIGSARKAASEALHLLFVYAFELRWIDYNPVRCRALPTLSRKVVLSIEETRRVIRTAC